MRSESQPSLSRRSFLAGSALATASGGASTSAAAQDGETVTIDMTNQLVFDPDEQTVPPGTTVVWENVGTIGHSVTAYEDEIPDEADYFASGDFDSEQAARNAYPEGDVPGDESFEHTFEVEGEYGYFCIPHESAGMVASLTVGEVSDGGDGDGGGGADPDVVPDAFVPESAIALGVAAAIVMVSVIALSYVFIKYGGDYGTEE